MDDPFKVTDVNIVGMRGSGTCPLRYPNGWNLQNLQFFRAIPSLRQFLRFRKFRSFEYRRE